MRFDGPPLSLDLLEDLGQGLNGEDVFRKLGQQRQVGGLQAAAVQDAESAILSQLSPSGGKGCGRVGHGQGLQRRPVKVASR